MCEMPQNDSFGPNALIEPSETIIDQLCSYVRLGIRLDTAAMAEGIPPHIVHQWIDKGQKEQEGGRFYEFVRRLSQARAQGEILHIQRITASGNAKDSQWILERLYPEKWGGFTGKSEKKKKQKENSDPQGILDWTNALIEDL